MPKPFPDPNFTDTSGMVAHVNILTEGWATVLASIVTPIVIFVILKQKGYRISQCFLTSFFLGFFLSTFWWAGGLLDGRFVVLLLLLTIASAIYAEFDRD